MKYLLIIMLCISATQLRAKQADSARVYFEIASATLTNAAKHSLDSLIYNDVITKGRKVGLIGYADNTGNDSINNPLSLQRAKAVAAYLQYMGIDTLDIELVTGKGAIKRNTQQSYPADRRVDIIPGGFKINAPKTKADTGVKSLIAATKGQTVRLNNIVFEPNTPVILKKSYPVLEELTKTLKENPTIKIRIEGHVCCYRGDLPKFRYMSNRRDLQKLEEWQDYEQTLSEQRAREVRKYLMEHGISPSRLSCKGFGTTVPLYEADGKMNEDNNRRVEIRIMEK